MPRSRSGRSRGRGRRGRPPGSAPAGDQDTQATGDTAQPDRRHQSSDERPGEPSRGRPPVPAVGPAQERAGIDASQQAGQRANPRAGNRPAGQGRAPGPGGAGRPSRRRQPRRQPLVEVTGELIKPRALAGTVPTRMIQRTTDELEGAQGPELGCPMLSRTRLSLPVSGGHPAPRCSLGWGLHTEQEALYCMLTPDLTLCWKVNPGQLEAIRDRLGEQDTATD